MSSRYNLVIQNVRFPLKVGSQTIGRLPKNDIQIDDPSVSRVHATLTVTADGVRISDRESHNGTFVNGVKVFDSKLVVGDQLHFGSIQGRLVDSRGPQIDDQGSGESTIGQHAPPPEDRRLAELSEAERRVFWATIDGKTEQSIATKFNRSVSTIHNHKRKIFQVFNVRSVKELIAAFLRRDNGPPPPPPPPRKKNDDTKDDIERLDG